MRIRRPRDLCAATVAALLAVSCTNPGFVCGCSPPPAGAFLYGRVTDGAGAGVAGARVVAELAGPGCAAPADRLFGEPAVTGADGRYRAAFYTHRPAPDACTRAYAEAPAGSTLQRSDTVGFEVRFDAPAPIDSVRVDFVLRGPEDGP